jgi:hypothetical protein
LSVPKRGQVRPRFARRLPVIGFESFHVERFKPPQGRFRYKGRTRKNRASPPEGRSVSRGTHGEVLGAYVLFGGYVPRGTLDRDIGEIHSLRLFHVKHLAYQLYVC